MSQDERERLQRQRDRQLAARDPGSSKIRGYDWAKHTEKARQRRQKPFLQDLWEMIPGRWKGALMGLLFGLVIAVFLALLLPGELRVLAVLPLLICAIVGMVIGKLVLQEERFRRW